MLGLAKFWNNYATKVTICDHLPSENSNNIKYYLKTENLFLGFAGQLILKA